MLFGWKSSATKSVGRITLQVPFSQLSKIRQFQSGYVKKLEFEKKKQMHKSSYNIATLLESCGQTRARELKILLMRTEENSKRKTFFSRDEINEPAVSNPFRIGDSFRWGSYPIDSTNQRVPIEWHVIKKYSEGLVLLSDIVLDCQSDKRDRKEWNWQDSHLREWLNIDFVNAAFSEDEKKALSDLEITSAKYIDMGFMNLASYSGEERDVNSQYRPDNIVKTSDKVFLLNAKEFFELPENLKKAEFTSYFAEKYKRQKGYQYLGEYDFDRKKYYAQKWHLRDRGAKFGSNYTKGPLCTEAKFDYHHKWKYTIDNDTEFLDIVFEIRPAIYISLAKIVEIYGV